jgi:hypothetical protein
MPEPPELSLVEAQAASAAAAMSMLAADCSRELGKRITHVPRNNAAFL